MNGDNFCVPLDAVFIINYLNSSSRPAAEAERVLGGDADVIWLIADPHPPQAILSRLDRDLSSAPQSQARHVLRMRLKFNRGFGRPSGRIC